MRLVPVSMGLSLIHEPTETGRDPAHGPWPLMSSGDRDYWLGHCQGFRVFGPEGWMGTVSHVVYGSRVERPDTICVRSGLFRRHDEPIPASQVVTIRPEDGSVLVAAPSGLSTGDVVRAPSHAAGG